MALQTGNLELRTNCKVAAITTDDKSVARGVQYFDPNGVLQEQRARVVILSAFVFEHVRLLLLSKSDDKGFKKGLANSSGLVGKCFFGHGDMRVYGLFDDFIINGFIGSGAAAMRIDDFNGNNFDHTGLGFIRGGTVGCSGDGAPVSRMDIVPPGMPTWEKNSKSISCATTHAPSTFTWLQKPCRDATIASISIPGGAIVGACRCRG